MNNTILHPHPPKTEDSGKLWDPDEKNEVGAEEDGEQTEAEWTEEALGCPPMDFLMKSIRPNIREMEAQERRRFCADMKAKFSGGRGNRTGLFFNGFAGAPGRKDQDEKELGRRIMAKRNPNYKPEWHIPTDVYIKG